MPLLMSAVHVFYQDKMAAVGHLIGSDQLPLPHQVSSVMSPGCVGLFSLPTLKSINDNAH